MDWGAFIEAGAFLVREISLFAATGFLVLGAGDLAIDFIWLVLKLRRLWLRPPAASVATLAPPAAPGRLAIFVPAWEESAVIGAMLGHAVRALDHPDYRIFVGCYPNDPATGRAAAAVDDPRIRIVTGCGQGPTTKADNLNSLWQALLADEAATGVRYKAVVLHDAEDVVHSAELRLFDALIERFDLVQLPVLPLIDPKSRWVAAHYADEFAESHAKELVVREALGAAVPSAGVGCAISREALQALAAAEGVPFDPASLAEDYELGLKLRRLGRRGAFVRLPSVAGGAVVATRGHFPIKLDEAVGQKSRWIAGIALSGWDRLGWSGGLAERWMRLRDRQSLLAALLLLATYTAMILGPIVASLGAASGHPVRLLTPALEAMMLVASLMLVWRLAFRFAFVTYAYGLREGLRSVPRIVVSNAIAMLAARKAIGRYRLARATGAHEWGKTAHSFPAQVPAE